MPPSIAITPALGSQRFGGPYPGNAFDTGSQTHGDTPDGKRISGIFGHANLGAAFAGLDEVARKCPPPDKLNGIPGCVVNALSIETQSFVSRSKHPGGVHASRCDGSVQFYVDGIDLTVWRGLSTARGAEPVFDP